MQTKPKKEIQKRLRVKTKLIEAGGGVVFKAQEGHAENPLVLLIFRNGFWDLPKGKLEKGELIAECACREVAEETNSELPIILHKLPNTYHEYIEKNKKYGKTTHWYVMRFQNEQSNLLPQEEEGIEEVVWKPVNEALEKVGFDNLKDVLNSFKNWLINQ